MKPTESLSQDTTAVAASLAVMIEKEHTIYTCKGYLDPSDTIIITADDRMALVDWCYDFVDHCHISREVVASAMEMVDRFLSIPSQVTHLALHNRKVFQLLTIAALYSSIKVNETLAVGSTFFSEMSHSAYTAEEIENMELTLLIGLSWRCHAPTAHQVGLSILSLILPYVDIPEVTWGFLMDEMQYLTELAVRDYYLSTQRASTVALAAILKASNELDIQPLQDFMKAFSSILIDFGFEDIDRLIVGKEKLASLIVEDPTEIKEEAEEHNLIIESDNQCASLETRMSLSPMTTAITLR